MPVTFIPDPHKGPGHGILLISPMHCENAPTFAITNASTRQCLAPEGWQSAEVFLEPDAWDCENEQLRLAVGPAVVDHLDSLDMYKLQLKDDGGNIISYGLTIDDIVQSSMAGGQGMAMAAPVTAPVAAMTAPQPTPEPEPDPTTQAEPDPLPSMNMEEQEPAKKSPLALIIAIVLLCALLGAGIWWYLQQQAETSADVPAETSTPQTEEAPQESTESAPEKNTTEEKAGEEAAGEAKQSSEQGSEQNAAPSTPQEQTTSDEAAKAEQGSAASLSPMDSARTLLRKNDTGEQSHSLATTLREQAGSDAAAQDAVFLLFEDAAQKGVAPAMSELAGYYDPTNTAPKGSISPDAEQAHHWYSKAQNSGDAKAQEHLQRLQTWAEEEAKKGNATAKNLLNTWKK